MQFQFFTQNQPKDSFAGELLAFDDAFDTDSLKKFYRQQAQPLLTVCTNFTPFFAKAKVNEFDLEEASSPSVDERETQASPLTKYINKYSQENSPLGVNLDYQFYGEQDPIFESNPSSFADIPRQSAENNYAKSAGEIGTRQPALKLQECKPVVSSYPQLNMTAANNVFSFAKGIQPSLTAYRKDTQSTDCSDSDRSPSSIEKLFKTKKIFKIHRDTKPRTAPKQKVSSPKVKPVKIPAPKVSPLKLSKAELPTQAAPAVQDRSPAKTGPAPVMSFLNIMQEKGYTPEQVMSEIQKFVHPGMVGNFGAKN